MHRLGDRNAHYWLALRMAKATGADLTGAVEAHTLEQADWATMVERCRACTWAEGCQRWLSDPENAQASVPVDCANQDRFSALSALRKATPEA